MSIPIPRSNAKDLSRIRVRKQNRDTNATPNRPEVAGADSETHDGNIFLFADSIKGVTVDYPNVTFEEVADALLRLEGKVIFFHNLGYDADCILKLIPAPILKGQYSKTGKFKFQYNGYTIFYIDKKKLTIRRGNHSVSCYDIMQYYDNKSLVQAYCDNIGKALDLGYLAMKDKRKYFTVRNYRRHKKSVREYTKDDCRLTEELGYNWIDRFCDVFGFYCRNWISPGYLAEKVLHFNNIPIPYFNDIPYMAQELAWCAFYGGRFELIKRGFIGTCYLYDINSAYPHALTKIPDLTDGRWVNGHVINKKAVVGFFHIMAHIDPLSRIKVAPFPLRTKKNMMIYPIGDFETFVTLEELKAVAGDNRISYDILESWQFIPNKGCRYPFKDFIERLYCKRLELKDKGDSLEHTIKVILNAMYGKTAERIKNGSTKIIGNIFVPVICSFIAGYTRAQLYKFVRDNNLEDNLVAFATDSIALTKKIDGLNSRALGDMKLDKQADDVIYLSNGFYRFNGNWKQRGVGYDPEKSKHIEHLDTRIDETGELYIKVKTTRTTHIRSGILYNRLKSVGVIEEYEKKINLNADKKRWWQGDPRPLNEIWCNDSLPLNANELADKIAKKEDIIWQDRNDENYEPESDL